MKKIGFIVFIVAIIIGVTFGNLFNWGKTSAKFFNFSVNFGGGVKGSGNKASEKRETADFKAIEVGGIFEVEVVTNKNFSVEVETDDNLLQHIKTEVNGDTLEIKTTKRISPKSRILVRVSAPDVESLDVSGASKISVVNLKNESLKVDASGASKIRIEGESRNLEVELSGASKLDAENLKTENANVNGSGASNAALNVTNDLRADLSGASKVTYLGNPRNLEKNTSGASCVKGK